MTTHRSRALRALLSAGFAAVLAALLLFAPASAETPATDDAEACASAPNPPAGTWRTPRILACDRALETAPESERPRLLTLLCAAKISAGYVGPDQFARLHWDGPALD